MPRTLIYKRTHPEDPDREGRFGIHDCMGRVRSWGFDAVIGVGGIGSEPKSHGLDGKVNWIGIGAHKSLGTAKRGPVVTFDHFRLFEANGPNFSDLAPQLAARIYSRNVRVLMNRLDATEQQEVKKILALAEDAPPSIADRADPVRSAARGGRCRPRAKPIKGCSS